MTEDQIKHMVNRFLQWRLPKDFNPDGGVSFEPLMNKGTPREMEREPSGTNLFHYGQAEEMVRFMIADIVEKPDELDIPEHLRRTIEQRDAMRKNSIDDKEVREDIIAARKILSELCLETHKWRMCVPVQKDDSDMILSRVIDRAALKGVRDCLKYLLDDIKDRARWMIFDRAMEEHYSAGYEAGLKDGAEPPYFEDDPWPL